MCSSTVCSSPPKYYGAGDEAYKPPALYKEYIRKLCTTNPSFHTLLSFISNPRARSHGWRAAALDFRHGQNTLVSRRVLDIYAILSEIRGQDMHSLDEKTAYTRSPLQGRILIIEDLTVEMMQLLGSELDLDPLFLATHLHTVHRTGMRHQTPDDATLPSRLYGKDYVNISYHQPVSSKVSYPSGSKFSLDTAIDRKLVFLRATSIGLVQHRASIIKIQRSPGLWLALVLVDPPLGDSYFRCENKGDPDQRVHLDLQPYLGDYESFTAPMKFSEAWEQEDEKPNRGMLDDLLQYWTATLPDCFDPTNPSIQSLAYHPMKIVAAEWMKYIAVMQHCIKMYEYEGSQLDLEKFNMDLRELQGWRRRSMVSQQKIRAVIRHLQSHESSDPTHIHSIDRLMEDFTTVGADLEDAGRRLENMLPVVTSLVQIIDARQSFAETANISRLTVLALIFVPLSYTSSLFSMNSENMPGSNKFWVYFAVAIPVTLIVFLIARPPTPTGARKALAWLQNLPRRRVQSLSSAGPSKRNDDMREDWVRVRSETMRL